MIGIRFLKRIGQLCKIFTRNSKKERKYEPKNLYPENLPLIDEDRYYFKLRINQAILCLRTLCPILLLKDEIYPIKELMVKRCDGEHLCT